MKARNEDVGSRRAVPDKTLILIRHAHRDTANRSLDNGLSGKGLKQRKRLTAYYRYRRRHGLETEPLVLSSPKLRCRQTLDEVAAMTGTSIQVDRRLDEQDEDESDSDFRARVAAFVRWWTDEGPGLTVACSHGDWIPLVIAEAAGARVEVRKGSWAEIRLRNGVPVLTWLIQTFKAWIRSA